MVPSALLPTYPILASPHSYPTPKALPWDCRQAEGAPQPIGHTDSYRAPHYHICTAPLPVRMGDRMVRFWG